MSDETDVETVEGNENGVTIKPVEGRFWCEDVQPWEQSVDGTLLLNEIAGILRRFVVLPKWAPEALALWVVHTYAYDHRGRWAASCDIRIWLIAVSIEWPDMPRNMEAHYDT